MTRARVTVTTGFIDLEPTRNWGHKTLTPFIHQDGRTEVIPSQFPPLTPPIESFSRFLACSGARKAAGSVGVAARAIQIREELLELN